MTLLPFTLEAWRSGLQPCTADGRYVVRLGESLTGFVDGHEYAWHSDGSSLYSYPPGLDLRLRPKTEKRWVIVWRNDHGGMRVEFSNLTPPSEWKEIARVEIEVPVL